MGFFWTILTLVVALALCLALPGLLYGGRLRRPPSISSAWAERPVYRLLGTSPDHEQSWQRYAASMIIFSGCLICVHLRMIRDPGVAARSTPSTSGR